MLGLLAVQLLSGIMLSPLHSFLSIYLNEQMGYSLAQVARVIALGQIVGMLASFLGGSLSDSWGHQRGLALGLGLLALSCLLYTSEQATIVILLWALSSAGLSLSALSGQGYLTLAASPQILGLSSALYNWGYTLGGAIGAPLAAKLLGEDHFSRLGITLAALALLTLLVSRLLPDLHAKTKGLTRRFSLDSYHLLYRPNILMLGLLRFLPTCFYGLMPLVPLLIKQHGGSNADVAIYVSISSIFASLTQLLAGWLADRVGLRSSTLASFSLLLLAILGLILSAHELWGLYIFGSLGLGAAWALATLLPSLVNLASERAIHGRVFGLLHVLWTLAMMLGTRLGGTLLEINMQLPFVIVGLLNLAALLISFKFFHINASLNKL
ncbi:MAG: MFS transporter [Deinococcales bacterium]